METVSEISTLEARIGRTRLIDGRQLDRSVALRAAVVATEPGAVDFGIEVERPRPWSGFPDFGIPALPDTEPARMRVESIGGEVLRVRFGFDTLRDGISPMLAASAADLVPEGDDPEVGADQVVLSIGESVARVQLDPFLIEIVGTDGRTLTTVGGPEKNAFGMWDAWPTGVSRAADGGPVAHETFAIAPGEAIWGMGEHFTRFDRAGSTVDLEIAEAFGTGSRRAYKRVPFWISSAGYGVFVNQSAHMTVWAGSLSAADLQLAVEDDHLDWFLFVGEPKKVLAQYTGLTGRAVVPPRWSFGFWQSKISYSSQEEVLDVARRQRAAGVPVDVVHVDTHWFREDWRCDLEFDPVRFPDPAEMARELADLGVHLSLWQLPYIPEGSKLFDDLASIDGFVRDQGGEIYDVGICMTPGFSGRVGCVDFTNPAGRAVYQAALRRVLEAGASVIKVDFGESVPGDGVWHDGTPSHHMHNLYPVLYADAVAEVTREVTGDSIIWARSAWAGSQRYPVHWGGDNHAAWSSHGPQIAGGLGLGMCGFSFWSFDIGGFSRPTGGDQLVRSMQAGVLVSHSRIHGFGRRELDTFDERARELCLDALRLRYRLLPYLWAVAATSAEAGLPMMRPLALEFPADPTTWPIGDQWLLGDSLLVAPVMNESGKRRAYLPEGRWQDWFTGEVIEGPRWLDLEVPIERIPLWLREGQPVPLGPEMPHVDAVPIDSIEVRLLPLDSDGSTSLYGPIADDQVLGLSYRATGAGASHALVVDSPDGLEVSASDTLGRPLDVEILRQRLSPS